MGRNEREDQLMGYDVYYSGEFTLSRSLTETENAELELLTIDTGEVLNDFWFYDYYPSTSDRSDSIGIITSCEDSNRGDPIPSLIAIMEWLNGYSIEANGVVEWGGEDSGDMGNIEVRANEVRAGAAKIVFPKWDTMTADGFS